MTFTTVDPDTVKRKLRFEYIKTKTDISSRSLDGIVSMLNRFHSPRILVHEVIQDAATNIQRQFRLRWVMVGLRDPDGLYRYKVMSGMRPEAWDRHLSKKYAREDFAPTTNNYQFGEISKLSRIYLEEENSLTKDDELSVNRPALLRSKRTSENDCLEADFIDTLILGPHDEMLGWIEYSGTVAGEFPDSMAIRYIELSAAIISAAISKS